MADRRVRLILEAQVDNFNTRMKQARDSADGLGGSLRQAVNQPEVQAMGRTLTAFGVATTAALGAAAKSAMDWETSWTDVMRRTDGTPQQLAALEEGLRGIAREMPATHQEIAEVAASAAQLGVAVDDVEDFTRTMIMMGETTNMTADQAATSMARFANVMGTSHDQFDNLGSAIVDLGNNAATTESEIMDMAQRIAGAGNAMGMSEGEVLGFATALSSVGVQAAAGGTAISRTMYDIDSAVSQGGEALEGFAEIAGMSADEFSRLWAEDAASGLESFVSGLGRIQEEGGSVAQALEAVGISEVRTVAAMTQMASAGDMLSESLARGNAAFDDNSAMAAEYAYIQETLAAQIQVFWNRVRDAAIDIGAFVLPLLEQLVNWAGDAVTWFSNLPGPVQAVATAMTGLAGGLSLALGSAILLAPNLLATRAALQVMAPAGSRARVAVAGLGKAAGIATVALIGLELGVRAVNAMSEDFVFSTDDAARALRHAAQNGEGLSNVAVSMEGNMGGLGRGFDGVGEALARAMSDDKIDRFARFGSDVIGVTNSVSNADDVVRAFDGTFAELVNGGNLDAAADGFMELAAEARNAGVPMTDMAHNHMPQLSSALEAAGTNMDEWMAALGLQNGYIDAATGKWVQGEITLKQLTDRMTQAEQDAIAAALGVDDLDESLDGMTEGAQSATEAMRELVEGLTDAGLIARDAMRAADNYEAALDALTESIKENGASLDNTTDAGRRNRSALLDIADAGRDSMLAMVDHGASQDELQGKLSRTRDDLFAAARQFTDTDEEARQLTRSILGVPEGVSIDSWMDSYAKEMADDTSSAVDNADGMSANVSSSMGSEARDMAQRTREAILSISGLRTSSSHSHTVTTTEIRRQQLEGNARRGAIPGYATGGVMGSGLKWVGEEGPELMVTGPGWVATARESQKLLEATRNDMPSARNMTPNYLGGSARQASQFAEAVSRSSGNSSDSSGPIQVEGRLVADGDQMVAIIDSAMRHPRVLRTASQGLADQSRRDGRRG